MERPRSNEKFTEIAIRSDPTKIIEIGYDLAKSIEDILIK